MICNSRAISLLGFAIICFLSFSFYKSNDWGFYGHKLINRMAVYTLPSDLIEFYKSNISFINDHAVDPDKRRYAVKGEAVRHFIDLDVWELNGRHNLDRDLYRAIVFHSPLFLVNSVDTILMLDTFSYSRNEIKFTAEVRKRFSINYDISERQFFYWFRNFAWREYEPLVWTVSLDSFPNALIPKSDYNILVKDRFTQHGILPYNLEMVYNRLVSAFKRQDRIAILKLSSDIGHYIGDAHVPLHTSANYNGQLSSQEGIHAFWESRIPELLAEKDFDFLVGAASYVEDRRDFFWKIIEQSHTYVDSVLAIEKRISLSYPKDQQYCFETRLGAMVKLPCADYAKLYSDLLDNQVEQRMQASILAIGCIWSSAWTDAGQPLLGSDQLDENETKNAIDTINTPLINLPIRDHE